MTTFQSTYQIHESTVALTPIAHMDYDTIVLENNRKLFIKQTPIQLIKQACLEGGASYEGRRTAVMYRNNCHRKVPIPIDPARNIFAFPTHAPTDFHCSWIFYHHIQAIQPNYLSNSAHQQATIHFKNGQLLHLDQSYYLIEKQMQRTAVCITKFSKQI